jgi:class 3 adenylate cyclase
MGEQEISVLFVDLRGYTTYSEDRTAAEIFSTVNRYTETVSRVIRTHGGTVVEFNGDGMMAVFGAPEPLACKERAAVEAGREVITAVRSLELGGTQPLVSVGVATGKARRQHPMSTAGSGARSAIRRTSPRAQSLTRELRAGGRRRGDGAPRGGRGGPESVGVPIRGRRQTEDVYSCRAGRSVGRPHYS